MLRASHPYSLPPSSVSFPLCSCLLHLADDIRFSSPSSSILQMLGRFYHGSRPARRVNSLGNLLQMSRFHLVFSRSGRWRWWWRARKRNDGGEFRQWRKMQQLLLFLPAITSLSSPPLLLAPPTRTDRSDFALPRRLFLLPWPLLPCLIRKHETNLKGMHAASDAA